MALPPYIADILDQPAALREALEQYPADEIETVRKRLKNGEFSRIVMTGMGASHNVGYPAWLNLLYTDTPAIHINTAELLHYGGCLIDSRTLLWMNSQSGRSVEIVKLLEMLQGRRPAFQLSMCNHLDSPMAQSSDLAVAIHAGDEATVSTKTYINTAAMLILSTLQMADQDWQSCLNSMRGAADAIESYLHALDDHVSELDRMLGEIDQMLILGRGNSMSAVWNGSLINKEAANCIFEGMNVADFRHGPLELASPRLTVMVLEGSPKTAKLNLELAREVQGYGAKVIWLSSLVDQALPTFRLPVVDETARPLVEILPFQMLSIVMAQRLGIEPGKFRHLSKVALKE